MSVLHITYEEKELPIKVGYYALKHTAIEVKKGSKKEISMEDIFSGDLEMLEPILFYSLKLGHKKEGKEFTIERTEVEFILDDCLKGFMEALTDFFQNGGMTPQVAEPVIPPEKEKEKP